MNDQNRNNGFSSLIIGIIIGAAATYLFTTKEGQKVKDRLLKEGAKLLDKINEGLEEVQDEVVEKGSELKEKVTGSLESAKEAVEDAVDEVPKHIEKIQKKGRRFFFKKHPSTPES